VTIYYVIFYVICFAVGLALLWFVVIEPARETEKEVDGDVKPSADDDSSIHDNPDSGPSSDI
jgi:hypothetical protein